MGRASSGGTCPLCRNPVSFTATGKLYRHRGNDRALASARRLECRASGATFEVAIRLRANKDAGRNAYRNEDGSWLYVCSRCGRQEISQSVDGPVRCLPRGAAHCIRPPLQLPTKGALGRRPATYWTLGRGGKFVVLYGDDVATALEIPSITRTRLKPEDVTLCPSSRTTVGDNGLRVVSDDSEYARRDADRAAGRRTEEARNEE